jgi:hypothetical protein
MMEDNMRATIKEWKNEWIETNGETDELEVLISYSNSDTDGYIYEGSFVKIPTELEENKVISWGKVLDSTVPARVGAYSLKIVKPE